MEEALGSGRAELPHNLLIYCESYHGNSRTEDPAVTSRVSASAIQGAGSAMIEGRIESTLAVTLVELSCVLSQLNKERVDNKCSWSFLPNPNK